MRKIIKISGQTPEQFQENLRRCLEVSAVICNGHVGSDDERSKIDPNKEGILWYYKEEDQKKISSQQSKQSLVQYHRTN